MTIYPFALVGIDAVPHPVGVVGCTIRFFYDERHLSTMAFRGVRRHLAAIDSKQFVSQQPLLMANELHLLEQYLDLLWATTHETGNGRKVRYRVTRQRFENDVGFTAPLDLAAGGDAFGVGEQDNL